MKVCFIGLGSIALRHIRNLKDLYGDSVIIDVLRSQKSKGTYDKNEMLHDTYYNYGDLPLDYDVIFITNPTGLHFQTLKECQNMGNIFL